MEPLTKSDAYDIINFTYNYMLKQIKPDGTFVYSVNIQSGEVDKSYNFARHCGSIWSLLSAYRDSNILSRGIDLKKIDTALDYILNNCLKYQNPDQAFIIYSKKSNKIASTALAILSLIERYQIDQNQKYLEMAKALASGLISLQDETGDYCHALSSDLKFLAKNLSEIYDGEINFALLSMYQLTKDDKYLSTTRKSMQSLKNKNALDTSSQWLAYVYLELFNSPDNAEYITDFLQNISKYTTKIAKNPGLCDMEYLGCAYEFLTILSNDPSKYHLDPVTLNNLFSRTKTVFYNRARAGVANMVSLSNVSSFSDKYLGCFFKKGFEARIDYSQHNLSGYRLFYQSFYGGGKPFTSTTKKHQLENPYVNLARRAVEAYVKTGQTIDPPYGLPPDMLKGKNGVYVSIKKDGQLRGCRGSRSASTGSIAKEIIASAIKAAMRDDRFNPITEPELSHLAYRVYILDPIEKVKDESELDPNVYGIVIFQNNKRGLMLPMLDTIHTAEEQIRKTLKKGNIDPTLPYDLYRFRATKYV